MATAIYNVATIWNIAASFFSETTDSARPPSKPYASRFPPTRTGALVEIGLFPPRAADSVLETERATWPMVYVDIFRRNYVFLMKKLGK